MRNALLTILILTLLPLAAADGPSASVDTLTSDGGCASNGTSDSWSYGGWYDNDTRYASYSESQSTFTSACNAESDTLAAHAGDAAGPLADARVYQQNASSYADHHHDSSSSSWGPGYYSYGYGGESSSAWNSSDERGARADALGATAGQTSGCASHSSFESSGNGYSSYWYDPYWGSTSSSRSNGQSQNEHAYHCADGADAAISGHGASASNGGGCSWGSASSSDQYSSSYAGSWYSESYSRHTDADECRSGLSAASEGSALFAGRDDACSRWEQSYDRASSWNEGNASDSGSYGQSQCFHGYVVDGPDGVHFAAGNSTRSFDSCYQGECSSQTSDVQAVSWSWGASPVAFLAQGEWDTPVWIPVLS